MSLPNNVPHPKYIINIQIHHFKTTLVFPKSIAGVLFDSVGSPWTTLLLHTTCMRSCCNWSASCVAALQTTNQKSTTVTVISMTLSEKSLKLHPWPRLLSILISLLAPSTPTSTSLALTFSLTPRPPSPSPPFSSFFCCCWGALLRSRSFHYHNHFFPLLVAVL